LEEGSDIILPPGDYYWKVRGVLGESKVQTFTIQSNVGLNLRRGEEKDRLENSGNVVVDVNEKKSGAVTNFKINVGESEEVEKDSDFVGGQDG